MIKRLLNTKVVSFLKESRKTTIGLSLILIMLIITFGAGMFTSHDPLHRYKDEYHSPPSVIDVFAQTLYGGRTSITVGVFAGIIAAVLHVISGPDHLAAVTPFAVESKKKAWNWIRFMVIGIMLTVGLLFIFPILFKYMGR